MSGVFLLEFLLLAGNIRNFHCFCTFPQGRPDAPDVHTEYSKQYGRAQLITTHITWLAIHSRALGMRKATCFFFCIRRLPLAEHSFAVIAWFFTGTSYFAGEPRFPKVFQRFRITVRFHLPRPGSQLNLPFHRSVTIDFPLVLAVWRCDRWTRRRGPHSFSTCNVSFKLHRNPVFSTC